MADTFSVTMPDGTVINNVPEGTTKSDLLAKFNKLPAQQSDDSSTSSSDDQQDQQDTINNASFTGEAAKAVGRGFLTTGALLKEGLPAVFKAGMGELTGEDWGGEEQTKVLANALEQINNDPNLKAAVGSYTDVKDPHTAALYLANAFQAAPDLIGSMGTGFLVKTGLKSMVESAAENTLKRQLAAGATQEVAEAAAKKAGLKAATGAFTAGVAGYNQAVMTPSEQASIYQETGEVAPGIATGSAAIQNVGETLSDMFLGGKLGKEIAGRGVKAIGKAVLEGAATEGITEGAQALVSEGAQELANPDKAHFDVNNVIDQAIQGAAFGGIVKGSMQPIHGGEGEHKVKNDETFKPDEEVTPAAPEESPVAEEKVKITPEAPVSSEQLKMDERPEPPLSAYETDAPRPAGRPKKVAPAPTAMDGLKDFVANTADPKSQSPVLTQPSAIQKDQASKFNMYSNYTSTKGMKYRNVVKEVLDKVGFDEDVMLLDPTDTSDATWGGFSKLIGLPDSDTKELRQALQTRFANPANQGANAQIKAEDGSTKHLFFFKESPDRSPTEEMRLLLHEGLGHTIANRFIMRDPVIKQQFIDLVKTKLNEKGLGYEGLSPQDVDELTKAWTFDNSGQYKENDDNLNDGMVSKNFKWNFRPVTNFNPMTSPGGTPGHLQYRTSVDEVMAEQIARWAQSDATPLTVLDKFFKSIADLYRSFIETAKAKGLMPWTEVSDFMNGLVMQAKGARVAAEYSEQPAYGLQELTAYHGTPHRFAKFSTDHVGTGEGYQAFGWGLYFTDSKKIAEYYKNKLSKSSLVGVVTKGDTSYDFRDVLDFAKSNNWFNEDDTSGQEQLRLSQAFGAMSKVGYDKAKKLYEEFGQPDSNVNNQVFNYLSLLKKAGFDKPQDKKGATYEVEILEPKDFMDWDNPVSKEVKDKVLDTLGFVPRIKEHYIKEWAKNPPKGEEIYGLLIDSEGSPKAASKLLNDEFGVKGIKYKAGQIAGIDSTAHNYVVFDDAAIKINEVYDDENMFKDFQAQQANEAADKDATDKESPFVGYRVNLKVESVLNTSYNEMNHRTNGVLQAFANNIGKPTLTARTNAVQQYLVMNDALTEGGIDSTYYPEVFRGLIKNTKAVPDTIRDTLDNNVYLLKTLEALRNHYKISKTDMKKFGVVEMQAEAYKLYNMRNNLKETGSEDYKKLDSFASSLPSVVAKSFDFLNAVKQNMKVDLNTKAGILNANDLVQGLQNDTLPSMESLMGEISQIRNQAKKETLEDRGLGEAFAEDPILELGHKNNTIGGGWLGRNSLVSRFIARYSPAFAAVKDAADNRREAITGFRHMEFEGHRDFFMLPDNKSDYLGSIMDEQRRLGNQAKVNPTTGFLEFKRKNKETGQVEDVVLKDPELARIYKQTQDTFKTVPAIHRNQLKRSFAPLFAKANLGFDPSQGQFDQYKDAVKKGQVADSNKLSPGQMGEIDQYFDTLKSIDKMLSKDYIPHQRFGTRGAAIKDKDGKVLWFSSYKVDNNGKKDKDSYQEFLDDYNEFKAANPDVKATKEPQEFDLTVDNISRQLGGNNKAMTLELLSQLLNSSNSKLFTDAEEKMRLSPEDLVKGKISNRGFMQHMQKTDENAPQGYSKDWKRVISSYSNSAAYFLGNLENEPKLLVSNAKLQNQSNASKNLKDYSQRFVNDILNPEENYAALRELQYVYAMGFNPSSALLQLQSLFTYMPGVLNLATNSTFESVSNLAKAGKIIPLFFDTNLTGASKVHESLYGFGDADKHEELIKKGKISRQQSDMIKSMYNKGILQALRSGDMIGVPSGYSVRGNKGKWAQRRNNFAAAAGIMMRTAEETTRGIQALGAIMSLEKPDNVMRLHNNLMQNDALYRNRINETFNKEPDTNYLAQFLVDKALGEYGKEARSPLQNSVASVSLIPFSTYPVQMLLNTYEFISGKYGADGRKAALWAIANTAITGGVKAIPAALFIKALVEFLIQRILGEDRDLEEELKKKAASAHMPDWITRIVTNGAFGELFGVDVSSRMSVDVPFATEFLNSLNKDQPLSVGDMLGVQGTVLEAPAKGFEMAMQGASAEDILAATIPNVAMQNIIKARKNAQGVTYRGMPSLTQEQGSQLSNITKRGLGFKPAVQGQAEDTINELKRDENRYKIALDRFKQPLKQSFKEELLAKNEKDREEAANKRRNLIQQLVKYMSDKKIPNIGQSVTSTLKNAQLEAYSQMQGLQGAAVKKNLKSTARQNFEEIYDSNY